MGDTVFVQSLADVTQRSFSFSPEEVASGIRAPRGSLPRQFWDLISSYSDGLADTVTKKPFPPIEVAARRHVIARDMEMRAMCEFFHARDLIDNLREGKEVASGIGLDEASYMLAQAEDGLFFKRAMRQQYESAWDTAREDRLQRLVAAIKVHVQLQQELIANSTVVHSWKPSAEIVQAVADEIKELRTNTRPVSDWFKAMSFCSSLTKRPYFSLKELPDLSSPLKEDKNHRSPLGRDVVQRFSDLAVR